MQKIDERVDLRSKSAPQTGNCAHKDKDRRAETEIIGLS